jgi:hypothetical protein
MKLLSMSALLLGTYAMVLGIYAWFEHEPLMVVLGIFPVLLFLVVQALDRRFEKRQWSWTTIPRRARAIGHPLAAMRQH